METCIAKTTSKYENKILPNLKTYHNDTAANQYGTDVEINIENNRIKTQKFIHRWLILEKSTKKL